MAPISAHAVERTIAAIEADLNIHLPPLSARSDCTPSSSGPPSPLSRHRPARSRGGSSRHGTPGNKGHSNAGMWAFTPQTPPDWKLMTASDGRQQLISTAGTALSDCDEEVEHRQSGRNSRASTARGQGGVSARQDRPVTRDTMALARLHLSELQGSRVIWRNSMLAAHVDEHLHELDEFAHYRYDCRKKAATHSRTRAQRWRRWRARRKSQEAEGAAAAKDEKLPELAGEEHADSIVNQLPLPAKVISLQCHPRRDEQRLPSPGTALRPSSSTRALPLQPKARAAPNNGSPKRTVRKAKSTSRPTSSANKCSPRREFGIAVDTKRGAFLMVGPIDGESARGSVNSESKAGRSSNVSDETTDGARPALSRRRSRADKTLMCIQLRKIKERLRRKCPSNLVTMQEAQWNKMTEDQRTEFRGLFDRYFGGKLSKLTTVGKLEAVLHDFGIYGRTAVEREELRVLCQEFSSSSDIIDFRCFYFKLVPQARVRIQELHRSRLKAAFKEQADSSGMLGARECQQINQDLLENPLMSKEAVTDLRKDFAAELESIDEEIKEDPRNSLADEAGMHKDPKQGIRVDFDTFELACHRSHETFGKRQRQVLHFLRTETALKHMPESEWTSVERDVLNLYANFKEFDIDESGQLDGGEVRCMLMEFGFLSGSQEDDDMIMKIVAAADRDGNSMYTFPAVLELITNIRGELRIKNRPAVQEIFKRLDKDGSGSLSMHEISTLFAEMGLAPTCKTSQNEIRRIVEAAQMDDDGEVSLEEFENLVGLVTEKLRTINRIQEMELGQELGIPEDKVREYRDVFWDLDDDGSGHLDIQELRKAMLLLRQRISGDMLRILFSKIDKDGNGVLDFSEFLELMHQLEKLAESDSRKEGDPNAVYDKKPRHSLLADRLIDTL